MGDSLLHDDWDRHWTDFSATSEICPATRYRQKLCIRLLKIAGNGAGVRLLDIGSGTGGFAAAFLRRFPRAKVRGLELSERGTELARHRVPGAEFEQRNLIEALPPGRHDMFQATHAVCSEVLEHLEDPAALLRNAMDYFGPDCRLVVTVPGGTPNAFDRHIGHRRHYEAAELRQLLESVGLEVEWAGGVGFPFFNLYRLMVAWRGEQLKQEVAGPPSLSVRAGMAIFEALFHFNLMTAGWQTAAVARRLLQTAGRPA